MTHISILSSDLSRQSVCESHLKSKLIHSPLSQRHSFDWQEETGLLVVETSSRHLL